MNTENSVDTTIEAGLKPSNLKHRLIGRVLAPAVRLWLRSQVQQVSELEVEIWGGDRQILTGYIPRVSLKACQAVYQGLHLSQIQLMGEDISINLGQVLRGKPVRLLKPLPVSGELLLQESDLNASLNAAMLVDGLTEFLIALLQTRPIPDPSTLWITKRQFSWQNPQIKINAGQVAISATLVPTLGNPTPILIRTGFQLASSHELKLDDPEIQMPLGMPLTGLNDCLLDLGQEVAIEELTLILGQLVCRGRINVMPDE